MAGFCVRFPFFAARLSTLSLGLTASVLLLNPQSVSAQTVFINELHYDNTGADVNEGIEIAGPAGTSLSGWSIVLYDGTARTAYNTRALSGTIPNQQNSFGTLYFSYTDASGVGTSIQNGAPDGLALVNSSGQVVQFLSYEGSFVASGGAANGLTSTNIGVSEEPAPAVGLSLQLSGSGRVASDFIWNAPRTSSSGAINAGQTFLTAVSCSLAGSVRIHDIQGSTHISPRVNQAVSAIPGIVTAIHLNSSRNADGFYFQDPDGCADTNSSTSEAVFVFTSTAPTVAIGDSVLVSGTVQEYYADTRERFPLPATSTSVALPITQIASPTVTIQTRNNALPTAITLGTGGRIPPNHIIEDDVNGTIEASGTFDPTTDGLDFYETLEAMRVQVNSPVVVGPSNSTFGELTVVADNGANSTGLSARGSLTISATDFNPERIIVGNDLVPTLTLPTVNVKDRFNGPIQGILDYVSNNFQLLNTSALPSVTSGGLTQETTTLTGNSTNLTIATFNVENLNPASANDPNGNRFTRLGAIICNNLRAPDILSIEEIQDNDGPTNSGTVDATTTINTLITAIRQTGTGCPTYSFQQINPVNNQDGGQPSGNIRQIVLYNSGRVSFQSHFDGVSNLSTTATQVTCSAGVPSLTLSPGRIDPQNSAWSSSRKPLAVEFLFNGKKVFFIANHLVSKGGDDPLFGRYQPPLTPSADRRTSQANILNPFVQRILTCNPSANVIVLGDLNDFPFDRATQALKGTILTSLEERLASTEQYTFNFQGNAQAIDNILTTSNLANNLCTTSPPSVDIVHVNSEFSVQVSDHEPEVACVTVR
ncbi:endonuclease/exonuclease/phosphatase family protein [Anthocerotibacter panamensis]|uniref:endonuclease/exonuclease/phosphatase family protein n=1 Tax=Anthocerotibacter panamensis TaxID=2857077 RepID=UPI001C408161|nr:endonuclease/exonuclease/phosphatase family protein [Anthocerotibacter panamensis]